MTNLSNEHRLKQNIRVASIEEFKKIIGGMGRSEILSLNENILGETKLSEEQQDTLHQILQGSSGGTYFIDDIIRGGLLDDDSDNALANKLSSFGFNVPATNDFILYYESDFSNKQPRLSKSSIKECLKDKDVSFKKVTKKVNDKDVEGYGFDTGAGGHINNIYVNKNPKDIPNRITNPTIGAISFLEGRFSIPNRGSDEINLFFNAIPTLEMSKCVPYISLIMVYGKAKGEESNMSLGSFFRFLKEDSSGNLVVDEGIPLSQGSSRVMGNVTSEQIKKGIRGPQDIFDGVGKEKVTTAESGIELFLSPQTLSNSNIKNTPYGDHILEPIMPLMTLEGFNVSISGLGHGLYASKTASLKIHLHDRSRLSDIAPLVSPEQFGETRIIIEYGWSHPDESLTSGNPVGQFLGSLRDVGIFTVSSSKMDFSGQGASIEVRLAMMGGDDSRAVSVACGKFVQGKIFKPQVERIIKEIQDGINPDAYNKSQLKEIRKKHKLSIRDSNSLQSIIEYEKYLEALKYAGLADDGASRDDEAFVNLVKNLFDIGVDTDTPEEEEKAKEGFNPSESGKRLVDAIGSKIQSLYTVHDPFIKELLMTQSRSLGLESTDNKMSVEDFKSKLNDVFKEVSGLKPYAYAAEALRYAFTEDKEKSKEPHKEICTLGLLMMKFIAESLITTSRYDQIQVCFYPLNNQAGAARIYSTASYPVIINDFKKIMEDHLFKNPNITVNKFLNLVDKKIVNDFENPVYGLSAEMGNKKKIRQFTKEGLKKLSDAELSSFSLTKDFLSVRKDIQEGKKLTKKQSDLIKDTRVKLLDDNKNSITNKLIDIYSQDNSGKFIGDPKFVIPDLAIYYETLPAIKPANSSSSINRDDSEYENKNILRIHVYDKNYSPNPELLHLKDLMASGDVTVEVNDDTGRADIDMSKIMGMSSKDIKNLIKSRVPSITYGTSFCNATGFSLSGMATGGNSIGNTLFLTALQNKDAPQSGHGGVSDIDDMQVMPMQASLDCLGMPIIQRGNQLYIDMSSNTTADNMYAVKSVNHTIVQGNFNTKVDLLFIAQNSVKDLRSKIVSVGQSLNKSGGLNISKPTSEEKKIATPSQEKASKEKNRRYAFTRDK